MHDVIANTDSPHALRETTEVPLGAKLLPDRARWIGDQNLWIGLAEDHLNNHGLRAMESVTIPPTTRQTASRPSGSVIDRAMILDRVDGDLALLEELISMFVADCPRALDAIRDAITQREGDRLNRAAHAFKGTVGNFDAGAAFAAAVQLERFGKERRFTDAEAAFAALQGAVQQLQVALASFTDSTSQCLPLCAGSLSKGIS